MPPFASPRGPAFVSLFPAAPRDPESPEALCSRVLGHRCPFALDYLARVEVHVSAWVTANAPAVIRKEEAEDDLSRLLHLDVLERVTLPDEVSARHGHVFRTAVISRALWARRTPAAHASRGLVVSA